jgi:glycosyltransferase involved in cell wall biosynthesis
MKSRMRIAHVVGTRTAANIRDTERHVVYLAEAQRECGLDATVLTGRRGLFFNWCTGDGIPTFVVADLQPGAFARGIAARLEDLSPEIIHCHDMSVTRTVVEAAGMLEVPCVVTLHEGAAGRIIPEIIAARRAGRTFTVITAARSEAEFLNVNGLAGAGAHYVPYGTRTRHVAQQQELGPACRPNLMTASSLEFAKGIDLAILAMVELRRRRGSECPVLNIYGAGDSGENQLEKVFGDVSEYLTDMTTVLRLNDVVRFHETQADVLNRCASDLLIVPSRFETGPLIVLEAMSRGMPVVACDVGRVAEMLPDRRYGRVVPTNSITALADAIDSMLTDLASGQFDPDLLIRRHQSHYSAEEMADRIATVYQSAMLAG